jgi:hypothetical protein
MLGFEKIELAQILLEKRALINEDLRSSTVYQEAPQERRPKSSKDSKSTVSKIISFSEQLELRFDSTR